MRLLRRLTPMLACMASQYAALATNFTRSGSASLSPGNLRAVGGHLNYWLKTPYLDLANAYRLHLNLEDLYVNHDYPRFYGFSLRCLSSLPRPSGRGRKRS